MNEQLDRIEELLKRADYLLRSLRHYNEHVIPKVGKGHKPLQPIKEGKVYEFRKQDKKRTV